MHTIGVAGGYDLFTLAKNRKYGENRDAQSIRVNRIFTMIMLVVVVVYCYIMPKDIIAKATSVFMGITAVALLPAYAHGLYSKKPNADAAKASIAAGTIVYLIWDSSSMREPRRSSPYARRLPGRASCSPER